MFSFIPYGIKQILRVLSKAYRLTTMKLVKDTVKTCPDIFY